VVKQMTLQERRNPTTADDIIRAMKREHEQGTPSLTRKDIAALVERKVTPRLITLIEELHERGTLQKGVAVWPNGVQGFVYALFGDSNGE